MVAASHTLDTANTETYPTFRNMRCMPQNDRTEPLNDKQCHVLALHVTLTAERAYRLFDAFKVLSPCASSASRLS